MPSILKACKHKRSIRKSGEHNILLLNSSTTAGYSWEYYTYALYLKLKSNTNLKPRYHRDRGVDNYKYVYFEDSDMMIFYYKDNKVWSYKIFEDDKSFEEADGINLKTQDEVINYLREKGYIS